MKKIIYSAAGIFILSSAILFTQDVSQKGDAPIAIGINAESRKGVADLLQVLLANEYVLYTKTLNFHWNVQTPHFFSAHAFFKEQYEQLFTIIDNVGERIRALGIKTYGSLKDFSALATIKDESSLDLGFLAMVEVLLKDHEEIIRQLRHDQQTALDMNDQGTNNFLIGIMEMHEKMAWMLRAHLADKIL